MKKSIIFPLLCLAIGLYLSGCSNKHDNVAPTVVNTFVIVPGAWQAPYAWQTVKAQLEAKGQKVVVVQLPAHGADLTPPQNVTMDVYRDKVISVIDSLNTNVILVGHSLAGMVISEVAEKIPAKISKMVYIAGYLPQSGQTLLDLAGTDTTSLLAQSLMPSADGLTLDVIRANITNIFIQDGTPDIQALLVANYRVEPAIPFTNKVILTAANFGSVNKYYIHTIQDHAVTFKLQNRMLAASPISHVYQLNTSHSPFLSKPDSVTILLMQIAK